MFLFLKYINPGNYYNISDNFINYIYKTNYFSKDDSSVNIYSSDQAHYLDFCYHQFLNGNFDFIKNSEDITEKPVKVSPVKSIKDNYIFLRRHFSKFTGIWVLFIRILTLNFIVTEIYYYLKSLKFKRIHPEVFIHDDFEIFESTLIKHKPFVSIIIPTLNRYDYLKSVLLNLENQDYKNFEVIICDQSEPINKDFYKGWNLKIELIIQREKALWLARNAAIKKSKGEYIALTEDDVEIPTFWLSQHLKCLDFFDSKISAGIFYRNNGLKSINSVSINLFKYSQQFPTGNSVVHRSVFEKIGLFDRQFEKQRMGDGEFGLRATINKFKIISNPRAFIIDVKAPTGGLRQMGSWDAWRPTSIIAPRPIPSVLYFLRKYFGKDEVIFYLIKNIPQSFVPYKFKGNKIALFIVFLILPIWFPIALYTVLKSWKIATVKLLEGDKIDYLI